MTHRDISPEQWNAFAEQHRDAGQRQRIDQLGLQSLAHQVATIQIDMAGPLIPQPGQYLPQFTTDKLFLIAERGSTGLCVITLTLSPS
ncbi:hypothetical protein A9R10_01355 [Aeromonas piscicola]|nr:hypothetical protein A9R10_01355 [Aeromonas piscicola]